MPAAFFIGASASAFSRTLIVSLLAADVAYFLVGGCVAGGCDCGGFVESAKSCIAGAEVAGLVACEAVTTAVGYDDRAGLRRMFILGTGCECSGEELRERVVAAETEDAAEEIEFEVDDEPDGELCRLCVCCCC
jgi:hypothetical protein